MADDLALALELNVAQRTDGFDAAADEQGVGHGGQAAHRVGARLLHVAQHEDPDGTQRSQADVGLDADELVFHPLLQVLFKFGEAQARHGDGADAGEVQGAVAVHRQGVLGVVLAEQLDLHGVAGADDVVRRYGDIGGRGEGGGHAGEQVVAELLQGLRRLQLLFLGGKIGVIWLR